MKTYYRLARPYEIASLALAAIPGAHTIYHPSREELDRRGYRFLQALAPVACGCLVDYGRQLEVYASDNPEPGIDWPCQIWLPATSEEVERKRDLGDHLLPRAMECPSCGYNAVAYGSTFECEACGEDGETT